MVVDFKEKEATLISSRRFLTTTADSHQDTMNQNQYQYQQYMDSGSESAFIGSWGSSSSSFLNTSLGSELDSNDTDSEDDNDEFIAELTRRMADYMLEEDEDEEHDDDAKTPPPKHSVFEKPTSQEPTYNQIHEQRRSYADTLKKSLVGTQTSQTQTSDQQIQPEPAIELYQVENQPRVGHGRKGKMSESTQAMKPQQHEHIHSNRGGGRTKNNELVNGGKGYPPVLGPPGQVGSGMRAIFLGGSGSRNASSGTGVFLPRSAADATDHRRKKPGCSTVLIPTRVLQALEQHFNNMESLSPSNGLPRPRPTHHGERSKTQQKSEVRSAPVDEQETKLPQEWIY